MKEVLVKIVKGTYGHKVGVAVVGRTTRDEAFLLDEEKAKRLVSLGVAVVIAQTQEPSASGEDNEDGNDPDMPTAEMSVKQLNKFAEPFGITYKTGTKKTDFLEQILTKMAEAEEENGENEPPPSFNLEDLVQ